MDAVVPDGRIEELALDDPEWAGFVGGRSEATCFHRPEWAELVGACYRYPAFVLVQRDGDGTVVAGLPVVEVRGPSGGRRWISLPFTDECGPLADGGGPAQAL